MYNKEVFKRRTRTDTIAIDRRDVDVYAFADDNRPSARVLIKFENTPSHATTIDAASRHERG